MVDGNTVALDRYSVSGVIWGRETLWTDAAGRLAALVSVDAEFDHFEAVRPELRSAVPQLVARAASDGMAGMAATAAAETPAASRQRGDCRRDHSRHDRPGADSERHRRRDGRPHCRRRSVEPRPDSAPSNRRARGGKDRDARSVGHARALRAGGVGADLSGGWRHDRAGRRQRARVHRRGARRGCVRRRPRPANAARRHHRRPGAARARRHPGGDAGRRPRVGEPVSRRRLRSDQDLQFGRARRPARDHGRSPQARHDRRPAMSPTA